ncbi:flagellar basal-body rod protein FlgG [Sporomusaceae bacterium BoRhaA]|uniref:flagellar basal-body rod protein FlgF n=1 Tax=Pelorhabdus rhamnosifermentans TaxID=2772457 RepID=UPI001C05F3A3|nr:flagellar basal-body rod protein FlgF [Pelorhabdus rhamnosifermentans]MBU2698953.1 flagellar basal-body rod protein FlgG [Pelorhabdus rhamnosifermentans]
MIRGIYTAASGMVAESLRTDTIANNLANVNTTSYKRDVAVTEDFDTMLMKRIDDGPSSPSTIGEMGYGSLVNETATIYDEGQINPTGNSLDLAISGKGYFTVQTPNGLQYTRNGSFTRSAQGELVTSEGYRVMGTRGPIHLNGNQITVGSDGSVKVDNVQTNQLQIVQFANDRTALRKQGSSLLAATGAEQPARATGSVEQGALERSNVNAVAEMVNLITGYRAYEINSKSVQAHDALLDKAVNEVGKS